jgi:hypothetical protein
VFNLIYDEKRNNKFTYVERKFNKKLLPPLQMANGNVINNVFSRNWGQLGSDGWNYLEVEGRGRRLKKAL